MFQSIIQSDSTNVLVWNPNSMDDMFGEEEQEKKDKKEKQTVRFIYHWLLLFHWDEDEVAPFKIFLKNKFGVGYHLT